MSSVRRPVPPESRRRSAPGQGWPATGKLVMKKLMLGVLGAATFALSNPALAQDFPLKGGNFWTVAEITIDDGHFGDYADHLAGAYRKNADFSKSKGWLKN